MHPREHRVGGLAAPEENSSVMAIAELGEDTVALQPVGDHNGTRLDGFLYERKQALRRGAHHAPHSDPANRTAAHLRANDDKCLLSDVPAPPTRLNPTDEGFVHLDRPGQTVPARPDHRTSKLVQLRPCGSIAAQAEDSLQSQRAGAVLLADDPPDSSEPGHQRRARILEERAGGHRRLVPTAPAHPEPPPGAPRLSSLAGGTHESVRPPESREVVAARFLRGEEGLDLRSVRG